MTGLLYMYIRSIVNWIFTAFNRPPNPERVIEVLCSLEDQKTHRHANSLGQGLKTFSLMN